MPVAFVAARGARVFAAVVVLVALATATAPAAYASAATAAPRSLTGIPAQFTAWGYELLTER